MKRIKILDDHGYFISTAIQTELHKHHALELIISKESLIIVRDPSGLVVQSKVILIKPDEYHQTTTQAETTIIFIEPESDLARRLLIEFGIKNPVQKIDDKISNDELQLLCEGIVPDSWINSSSISHPLDERIGRVAEYIRTNITSRDIKLEIIADVACLSSSRLIHLFKEQIGIPLRPFILWCRIRIAVQAVLSGMNLTGAAHEAGFSDASHLSRTFMDMFGVNPSAVLKQ